MKRVIRVKRCVEMRQRYVCYSLTLPVRPMQGGEPFKDDNNFPNIFLNHVSVHRDDKNIPQWEKDEYRWKSDYDIPLDSFGQGGDDDRVVVIFSKDAAGGSGEEQEEGKKRWRPNRIPSP